MTQRFRKALSIAASAAMLCSMLLYLPQDHLLGSWLVSAEEVSAEPEGEGTAENPYQISNADQLYWFAEHADTSAHAKLTDDIVVNENLVNSSGDLNSGSYRSWTPIGNLEATLGYTCAFSGTFDGDGHTISGLYDDTGRTYAGFVGELSGSGTIKNLGIVDSWIRGYHVGGVCGESAGTITYCYFSGTINVELANAGGLCGENSGTITNSYNMGKVSGISSGNGIGGVCGANSGTITNSYNIGTVSATDHAAAGGVSGINSGIITYSYNTGSVFASRYVAGGVCGQNDGTIRNVFNSGKLNSSSSGYYVRIGGLCGITTSGSTLEYGYNIGMLNGDEYDPLGGVCALPEGSVSHCWYNSDVFGGNAFVAGEEDRETVGGKNTAAFASGEVAYLLGKAWGQDLENGQENPALGGVKVYENKIYSRCDAGDMPTLVYSNTKEADMIPAHTYAYGRCKVCGAYKNQVGVHLAGHSLTLDGDIGVHFYMELDSRLLANEHAYMRFTLPNGQTQQIPVLDAKTDQVDEGTYYVFTCRVAAKEMTSEITAQICTDTLQGSVYSFTVQDYAKYICNNSAEYSTEAAALAEAMLQYGAYAKAYFEGTALAPTAAMEVVTADTLSELMPGSSGTLPEGITYYGTTLLLESNTVLRHYFRVEPGFDVSQYAFTGSKGNYYYIDTAGISVNRFRIPVSVSVTEQTGFQQSSGSKWSLSYSPLYYLRSVLGAENTDPELKHLVQAMYLFHRAALDYEMSLGEITPEPSVAEAELS